MKSFQEQVAETSSRMGLSDSEVGGAVSEPALANPDSSLASGLLAGIEKLDAAGAQVERAKKLAEDSKVFLAAADGAIPRLLETIRVQGADSPMGRDAKRLLTREVLEKKGLPFEVQKRVRVLYMKHVVLSAIEHGGVPEFDEVMSIITGLELLVVEPKDQPKPHYHIGDKLYAFSVPSDMRGVVEKEVVGGLNRLRQITEERVKQERREQRAVFESGTTITASELFDGAKGIAIVHVPFRRQPNKHVKNGWVPRPGGSVKLSSDGYDIAVVDATGSKNFVESMDQVRMARVAVPIRHILESGYLGQGYFNSLQRHTRITDHERDMMLWLHGSVRAVWEQFESAHDAEAEATISADEFIGGKEGVALLGLEKFHHAAKVGEPPKHFANLWVLVERGGDAKLRIIDCDAFAYELFSQVPAQFVDPGENFEKLEPAFRNFLRVAAGRVKHASGSHEGTGVELTGQRAEDLRKFAEGDGSAGSDAERRAAYPEAFDPALNPEVGDGEGGEGAEPVIAESGESPKPAKKARKTAKK